MKNVYRFFKDSYFHQIITNNKLRSKGKTVKNRYNFTFQNITTKL